MSKVTNLESVRAEKAPVCDYCGEEDHKGAFQCPRIRSVTFDGEEDTVTVRLYPPNQKFMAGGD